MQIVLVLIILPFLMAETRNYGYLFNKTGGFIQAMYSLLCNESAIKLELFINGNTGVIFYGENKNQDSSILVYFKRPGIYMNVTSGKLKFTVPFMLDFFNNEWNGWHEVEIRISKNRLGLSFDRILREAALNERFLFPENDIENNVVYFGRGFQNKQVNIQGFLGFMRNFLFMSCGCNMWQPVRIIYSKEINLDHLGECNSKLACQKGCSCNLFPWGSKLCDCSGRQCALSDHMTFYGFDRTTNKSLDNREQLQIISSSDNVQYGCGIFRESFKINDNNQWVMLSIDNSRTCFKNINFCENDIIYQFWLLPLSINNDGKEVGILKHSSSIHSNYGVQVTQIGNKLKFVLVLDSGKSFQLFSSLSSMNWNRVTVFFNKTHLNVYLNLNLINSTQTFTFTNDSKPNIINTKYLIIGERKWNPNFEIDEFKFSTDFKIFYEPSIQELRIENPYKAKQTNNICYAKSNNDFINLSQCFANQFRQSNFSLGFYISVMFNISIQSKVELILMTSFFNLSYASPNLLEISFHNNMTQTVTLRELINNICFLEISITSNSKLSIFQSANYLLYTVLLNNIDPLRIGKDFYLYANSKDGVVKEIYALNMDRNFSMRTLRIRTNKFFHNSMDFDHLEYMAYLPIELTSGYFGNGVRLSSMQSYLSLEPLKGSCIRNFLTCFNGFTVTFRIKIEIDERNEKNGVRAIFNSGKTGIILMIDNDNNFLLLISGQSLGKFIGAKLHLNVWNLLELSLSPNGAASLSLNDAESNFINYSDLRHSVDCSEICIGDPRYVNNSFVILIDEINIWDVHRWYLYANGFISKRNPRHKLYSFTSYQINKDLRLNGSAKLISTKYGQGLSLNGFGPRFAFTSPSNISNPFTVLDECHRGVTIFMWLRIDNLAINQQIFLSSPQFTVGANLGSLFVRLSTLEKVWYFASKDILQVLSWQFIIITWRSDNGLKVFLNKEYIGHVITGTDETHDYSHFAPFIYFGKEYTETSKEYSTIILDDVQIFDADLGNLAYNIRDITNISCMLRHSFDGKHNSPTTMHLGVIGNSGVFLKNISSPKSISIPKCFREPGIGCQDCFTLRFWMSVNHFDVEILQTDSLKLFVSADNFQINIFDRYSSKIRLFVCKFIVLGRNWDFLEISWDTDEGLIVFVNRELLNCNDFNKEIVEWDFPESIRISDSFNGFIDELELFKSRLSMLYWNEIISEAEIETLLQRLKDKIKLKNDMAKMTKNSRQGKSNFTIKYIQSFEFNGSNYLEYKMPVSNETAILGAKEEIEVSFKSFDNVINSIIWISDGKESKSILSLKNSKLYFTKIYLLPSSNGTRRVTEEFEIYQNIKANVIYNLLFYQKSGKFVIKITSIYETKTQSMMGRENLFPINGNVYFGGYKIEKALESNTNNSSFIGKIYKVRIKSTFNKESVDIIQEMSEAKSGPNIINHGNVKVVMKSIETALPAKASFLNTIIDRKMPLMIKNPFISVILPKWDFELLVSIELEFSTYESQGLLIFIGNSSHFLAVELFDSRIHFVYKLGMIWKRVGLDNENHVVNDNHFHNVYLGRDLTGHIKVFIDRKETLNNIYIPQEFNNSATVIGFYGSLDSIPAELLSRFGFIGCIHFLGVNDVGFLNFSRWTPMLNKPLTSYNLEQQLVETFLIDSCLSPIQSSCQPSPCNGGWCQLMSISNSGQPLDNYKCNCFYSSKSIANNFIGSSEIENYNVWIRRHLLNARSESCTADSPQILIIGGSYFKLDFNILYPFSSVMDLEFMILVKSLNSCVARISQSHGRDEVVVLVKKGLLAVLINENLLSELSNITISDGQWHGINLRLRMGIIQLKLDNVEKVFYSTVFTSGNFSTIVIGKCNSFGDSHFQIKDFQYNQLNIFQNIQPFQRIKIKNLFYTTEYVYPKFSIDPPDIDRYKSNPITFLNNFHRAIMNSTIILSWINKVDIGMIVQHPGSFMHFKNSLKLISFILCGKDHLLIIYKNGYLNSERVDIHIGNETLRFMLVVDLIKSSIELENVRSKIVYIVTKDLFSWNVGDEMMIEFGVNSNHYRSILSENRNFHHEKCLAEMANKSAIGCLQHFVIYNNKEIVDGNSQLEPSSLPPSSVFIGQCLGIERCDQNSCANGKCRSMNFQKIFCDCSLTPFTGSRCHIQQTFQCRENNCKNNGKCKMIISSSKEIENFFCQCNETGHIGKYCERSLCDQVQCVNNGKCHVVDNSAKCDCFHTGFTGQFCETSLCDSYSCNGHGYCKIDEIQKIPICDCDVGYIGINCEINGFTKCRNNCSNGGICTRYSPALKLCSNSYCQVNGEFSCNCDHTIFRGSSCEQQEFGFNPSEDGVIKIEGLMNRKYNYMRLLFEPLKKTGKMTLFQAALDKDYVFGVYTEGNNLWLQVLYKYMTKERKSLIGQTKSVNVLLLVKNKLQFYYYFNSKLGSILPDTFSFVRRRRNYEFDPLNIRIKMILGSDFAGKDEFNGLIAGFRWNGRDLADQNKTLWRNKKLIPSGTLKLREFPNQDLILIKTLGNRKLSPILWSIILIILFASITFYIGRKRFRHVQNRNSMNKDFIPLIVKDSNESERNSDFISSAQDTPVQSHPNKLVEDRTENHFKSNRILIFDDFDDACKQNFIDITFLPSESHFVIITKEFPKSKNFNQIFPTNQKDYEYSCYSVGASSNFQFMYSHSKRSESLRDDDLMELQVWKRKDDWIRVSQPPNVKFTFSCCIPKRPSELVLFNRHSHMILIWNMESSSVVWQLTLSSGMDRKFFSLSVSHNSSHILINYGTTFFNVDFIDDSFVFQLNLLEFPNSTTPEQIFPIHSHDFIIRNSKKELFVFDTLHQTFKRILNQFQVNFLTRSEYDGEIQWAFQLSGGEIYLTRDFEKDLYQILHPTCQAEIKCLKFSLDGSMICAGFVGNLFRLWKIRPAISVCRFHSIRAPKCLKDLFFTGDNRFVVIISFAGSNNNSSECVLGRFNGLQLQ